MNVNVRCSCGLSTNVPEEVVGKRGKCPHCGTVFRMLPLTSGVSNPADTSVPAATASAEILSALPDAVGSDGNKVPPRYVASLARSTVRASEAAVLGSVAGARVCIIWAWPRVRRAIGTASRWIGRLLRIIASSVWESLAFTVSNEGRSAIRAWFEQVKKQPLAGLRLAATSKRVQVLALSCGLLMWGFWMFSGSDEPRYPGPTTNRNERQRLQPDIAAHQEGLGTAMPSTPPFSTVFAVHDQTEEKQANNPRASAPGKQNQLDEKSESWVGQLVFPKIEHTPLHDGIDGAIVSQFSNHASIIRDHGEWVEVRISETNIADQHHGFVMKSKVVKLGEAVDYFSKQIELKVRNAWALSCRAQAHFLLGNSAAALVDIDSALRWSPTDVVYTNKGVIHTGVGDFKKAIEAYSQGILINPRNYTCFSNRGHAKWLAGDHAGAMADYDRAIELNPNHYFARHNRGSSWGMMGEFEKGIKELTIAISLDPTSSISYVARGDFIAKAYGVSGFDRAFKDYSDAIRVDPTNLFAYYNRGTLLANSGDLKGALLDYSNAVAVNPKYAMAYFSRAFIRLELSEFVHAVNDLEKAFELEPNTPGFVGNLAWLYAVCPDDGIRDGAKAVTLATKNCELTQWKVPGALAVCAAAHAEVGDFDKAVELQTEAIQLGEGRVPDVYLEQLASYQTSKPWRDPLSQF